MPKVSREQPNRGHILVTGGAGYIGSHTCKLLHGIGFTPVVLDDLSSGHREAVKWGPLVEGPLSDPRVIEEIFARYDIRAVMHFAARCYVGESVTDPAGYYLNNLAGPLTLLQAMVEKGISALIFSSSAATYGEPARNPISEDHPREPINPYGRSKLMFEEILEDFGSAYGLKSVSLRYFNAAGADPGGDLGEDHDPETHLIPLMLRTALGIRDHIEIFGDDYPTVDGTCIRDYVHVNDLARAHILALDRLIQEGSCGPYNLGNGGGYSVREVIETGRRVTGRPVEVKVAPRRPGDPAALVASGRRAEEELGWKPLFPDLETIIATAWKWLKAHPRGYKS